MGATSMILLTAAAGVAKGYSEMQQSKVQKKAYDANAQILSQNAAQTRMENSINEDTMRKKNRQELSRMRAVMGELGVGESSTTVGVLAQNASDAEQNALNLRYQGETAANQYVQAASDATYYGKQAQKQGKNAFYMGLLNGMGGAASTHYKTAMPADEEGMAKYGLNKSKGLWG